MFKKQKKPKLIGNDIFIFNKQDIDCFTFGKPYKVIELCRYYDDIKAFVKNDKREKVWINFNNFRKRND